MLENRDNHMRSIAKYVIFITRLLLQFQGVDCSCIHCSDYRLSEFDGKAVTDCQLASILHVEMTGLCTQKCLQDHRCRSYRYNNRTRTCSTYGCGYAHPTKTLNPVSEDNGSRLYPFCARPSFGMKCETPSNCAFGNSTCVDGVCRCVTGTSYDVTTGDCLIRCDAYGSEFSTYEGFGINGCNTNETTTSTMHECFAACKAEADFVCINAEYYQGGNKCNLCDTPALEVPEEDLEFGTSGSMNWTFAVRHCAY